MDGSILIIEDNESFRLSLADYFIREGFETDSEENGVLGLEKVNQKDFDIVILDVQMPFMDGYEVCQKIRQKAGLDVGIIMISESKTDVIDRVIGLEIGADVYLLKPFETRELLAQVKTLLRRVNARSKSSDYQGWYVIDNHLRINFKQRQVVAGGKDIYLTQLEFDLLKYLVERAGNPCSRSDLVDAVWGYEAGGDINDGAVNTCLARIRKKIEPDPSNPRYIYSMHGYGYRFANLSE
jgi:DNA-binding response OmpR family regulator